MYQEREFVQMPKLATANDDCQLTAGLKAGDGNIEDLLLACLRARTVIEHIVIRHLSRRNGFSRRIRDADFIHKDLLA